MVVARIVEIGQHLPAIALVDQTNTAAQTTEFIWVEPAGNRSNSGAIFVQVFAYERAKHAGGRGQVEPAINTNLNIGTALGRKVRILDMVDRQDAAQRVPAPLRADIKARREAVHARAFFIRVRGQQIGCVARRKIDARLDQKNPDRQWQRIALCIRPLVDRLKIAAVKHIALRLRHDRGRQKESARSATGRKARLF